MKKQIISIIALFITSLVFAQNGFNYKALISDNGNVLANQVISIKFTVLKNGTTSVYQETQTGNTDTNGIITFNIGEGSVVSGDFTNIDWGSNSYFLKVEINTGNGYRDFGTTEFKYVPYAKYADKAGNVFSGDFGDLNNVPAGLSDGDDVDDADHDPANEIQTISKTGNTISLSNGGGSVTDSDTHLSDADIAAMGYIKNADDADHDATNELQDLSLSGTHLSITNGTGVDFTNWDTDSTDDVQRINDLSDARTFTSNIFLGHDAGSNSTAIAYLTGLGQNVMKNVINAGYSVGIGTNALNSLTSGRFNVAIGNNSGQNLTTTNNNVFVGYNAGRVTTGDKNVFIGSNAGENAAGDKNVFIGYQAGINETGDEKLYIDNSSTPNPLIYGDFASNELTINGSLAINDGTQGDGKVLISDANGKGHWGQPTVNNTLVLGPMNVTMFDGAKVNYLRKDVRYGAYLTSQNYELYIPVNLPENATITQITFTVRDRSSSYDYTISLKKQLISNFYSPQTISTFSTSSSVPSFRSYVDGNVNETIDSDYHYFIVMKPKSGDNWQGNKSTLKGVIIHYSK